MANGLKNGRFLAWRLFRRDLKGEFTGSFFGYAWNFADPIILAGVFIVLRSGGLINDEAIGMSYALYVLFGMSLLQIFLNALAAPLEMISASRSMLIQIKVAPESILISTGLRQLFDAACYVPILGITSLALGSFDLIGFLIFIAAVPSMCLLGMSIGLVLAPLNEIYNDFRKLIVNLARPLIFICPTFYRPGPNMEWLGIVNDWNPIAILMNNLRLVAVQGTWYSPWSFVTVLLTSIVIACVGWLLFHVSLRLIVDPM